MFDKPADFGFPQMAGATNFTVVSNVILCTIYSDGNHWTTTENSSKHYMYTYIYYIYIYLFISILYIYNLYAYRQEQNICIFF